MPFSPSSFFSSLPPFHGVDFSSVYDLPEATGAAERALSPTNRGQQPQSQDLAHHTHMLSSSCATAVLHPPQQHLHLSRRLSQHPHPPEASQVGNSQLRHQLKPHGRMEGENSHDLASQQQAAEEYQPDLQDSLVGDKAPCEAITHEYAKADQVYVEKTVALPQTYSHYRPVRGDGNCGWRAIGFSYFEKLVNVGDQNQIEGEVARLKSLNHLLATVGGYDYFEDFADEAFDLLREVAVIIERPETAHDLIHQKWNETAVEGSLIFYFRLLAATYLKAHAATYEPFIPGGQSVAAYCSQNIEVVNREIEQLGIIALVNILLKPVNFVLEIAYLDRSPGTQVNRYRFPEEANEKDASGLGPIIYLLYRPDHYDILYRSQPVSLPATSSPPQLSVQVNRVTGFTHDTAFSSTAATLGAFATADYGTLSMIPGLSTGGGAGLTGLVSMAAASGAASPIVSDGFSSSHQDPWLTPYGSEVSSSKEASPSQPPSAITSAHPSSPPAPLTPTTPMCSSSSLMAPSLSLVSQQLSQHVPAPAAGAGYPIRFSPHQLEYESNSFPEPTFQVTTNTFKNSVWNRAHYGNPDFQPEEWNPDEDSIDHRLSGKKKARKDSN